MFHIIQVQSIAYSYINIYQNNLQNNIEIKIKYKLLSVFQIIEKV